MNGQRQNGRGRARGRAREMFPELPGERVAAAQRVIPQAAPPQPEPQPQPQPQASRPTLSAKGRPLPRDSGDLPRLMQSMELGAAGGEGEGGQQVGRGAIRGRRPLPENIPPRPMRPANFSTKQGTAGTTVRLSSNYFKLLNRTTCRLYHYHVDFAPEEDNTSVRKGLLSIHKEVLGGYIFDGMSMFTFHVIKPDPLILFSKRNSDDQPIRLTVRLVGDVADGDSHYTQVYNTIVRHALSYLNLVQVGRDFCDPHARVSLLPNHHMELWPKILTSIRQQEKDVMMCCEISFKKMSTDTALQVLAGICHRNPQRYQEEFKRNFIGAIVMTTYNNRTFRVDDVDFTKSPMATFKLQNGTEITIKEYYRTKHSIVIHDPNQPLLISRSNARMRRAGMSELLWLVPELCRTTGITDDMRNDFQLMKRIADHERMSPVNRMQKLLQFNQRLRGNDQVQKMFDKRQWNIELDTKLVEFEGRVLPQEKILAGKLCNYTTGDFADWTNNVHVTPMLSNITLNNWVVITPFKCKRDTESFLHKMQDATKNMKFVIAQPKFKEIADDRILTYKAALEEVTQRYNPQLIMCVMTSNNADRYAMIKKVTCCTNFAVPSQVILARNIVKPGMTIATKVAIQLNCKIGGAPWTVDIPLKGLMVVGFDVCHDTLNKGKSYGALVCSLDNSMTRYFSTVTEHANGEELSNFMALKIEMGLRKYQLVNGNLPQYIIIYRDGVGEGQYQYVEEHEVNVLKDRLKGVYGGETYKMAFIIVTKRINTRIFAGQNNPKPGTVVDECITLPERYDFFLVSQSVRQGTVSPTSYTIISDNVGLNADKLQRLTYKMTHLYYNWSGTVSVPAPTQYAHKLAYLVGKFTHKMPSNSLEDTLYFL